MASVMIEPAQADSPLVREVARVLANSLSLSDSDGQGIASDTRLFGYLPELDSMAVATVLTALEDHFHILIDDDEVTVEMFDTLGSLAEFVRGKIPA